MAEIHACRHYFITVSWLLDIKLKINTLCRLNTDQQYICRNIRIGLFKGDDNLHLPLLQLLSCTDIKRNILPAFIIHKQTKCRIGFRHGIIRNTILLLIMKILSQNNAVCHVQLFHRTQSMQYIQLFLMHILSEEGSRLFHCSNTENLKQMILHHILQRTALIVIAATVFHADRFHRTDLHMLNILRIPHILKNRIHKANCLHIAYHFFSQVMINMENPLFCEKAFQILV